MRPGPAGRCGLDQVAPRRQTLRPSGPLRSLRHWRGSCAVKDLEQPPPAVHTTSRPQGPQDPGAFGALLQQVLRGRRPPVGHTEHNTAPRSLCHGRGPRALAAMRRSKHKTADSAVLSCRVQNSEPKQNVHSFRAGNHILVATGPTLLAQTDRHNSVPRSSCMAQQPGHVAITTNVAGQECQREHKATRRIQARHSKSLEVKTSHSPRTSLNG